MPFHWKWRGLCLFIFPSSILLLGLWGWALHRGAIRWKGLGHSAFVGNPMTSPGPLTLRHKITFMSLNTSLLRVFCHSETNWIGANMLGQWGEGCESEGGYWPEVLTKVFSPNFIENFRYLNKTFRFNLILPLWTLGESFDLSNDHVTQKVLSRTYYIP